jgi:hypothetical protein
MTAEAPDPMALHPVAGQKRVVFLKPLVRHPNVEVGEYSYYAVVAGNPARVVRRRFDDAGVARLLRAAWWDWPIGLVTEHARTIMAGTPAELERVAVDHGLLTS